MWNSETSGKIQSTGVPEINVLRIAALRKERNLADNVAYIYTLGESVGDATPRGPISDPDETRRSNCHSAGDTMRKLSGI